MPLIPIDHVVPDPLNVRATPATPEEDADLLASVRAHGVVQPIVVRDVGPVHDPDLKAHIRETGRFPDDRELRAICQAPPERQAEALAAVQGGPEQYNLWRAVAKALDTKRIPLAFARFARGLYTGPVHGDLFAAEEHTEQAEDAEQFLELQRAWMQDECGRRLKQGWADAVILERDQYGAWKAPKAAQPWTSRDLPAKLPPKAERAGLVYSVGLEHDGRVSEAVWRKAPEKEKREAPPLGVPPKPVDPKAQAFTAKGIEALEKAKRRTLAAALGEETPIARDPDVLVLLLSVLLRERAKYRFGDGMPPSYAHLLGPDGRFATDGKAEEAVAYARELAAYMLKNREDAALETAERIGDWLGVVPSYPADPENLSMLKGPGVKAVADALGMQGLHTTQKAMREAIGKRLAAVGPEHLPAVGWQVKPAPKTVVFGGGDDEEGDEEEMDGDGDFDGGGDGQGPEGDIAEAVAEAMGEEPVDDPQGAEGVAA